LFLKVAAYNPQLDESYLEAALPRMATDFESDHLTALCDRHFFVGNDHLAARLLMERLQPDVLNPYDYLQMLQHIYGENMLPILLEAVNCIRDKGDERGHPAFRAHLLGVLCGFIQQYKWRPPLEHRCQLVRAVCEEPLLTRREGAICTMDVEKQYGGNDGSTIVFEWGSAWPELNNRLFHYSYNDPSYVDLDEVTAFEEELARRRIMEIQVQKAIAESDAAWTITLHVDGALRGTDEASIRLREETAALVAAETATYPRYGVREDRRLSPLIQPYPVSYGGLRELLPPVSPAKQLALEDVAVYGTQTYGNEVNRIGHEYISESQFDQICAFLRTPEGTIPWELLALSLGADNQFPFAQYCRFLALPPEEAQAQYATAVERVVTYITTLCDQVDRLPEIVRTNLREEVAFLQATIANTQPLWTGGYLNYDNYLAALAPRGTKAYHTVYLSTLTRMLMRAQTLNAYVGYEVDGQKLQLAQPVSPQLLAGQSERYLTTKLTLGEMLRGDPNTRIPLAMYDAPQEQLVIQVGDLVLLTGPSSAGKSTAVDAMEANIRAAIVGGFVCADRIALPAVGLRSAEEEIPKEVLKPIVLKIARVGTNYDSSLFVNNITVLAERIKRDILDVAHSQQPIFLFLDESLGGTDRLEAMCEIMAILHQLKRRYTNLTVVLVSHDNDIVFAVEQALRLVREDEIRAGSTQEHVTFHRVKAWAIDPASRLLRDESLADGMAGAIAQVVAQQPEVVAEAAMLLEQSGTPGTYVLPDAAQLEQQYENTERPEVALPVGIADRQTLEALGFREGERGIFREMEHAFFEGLGNPPIDRIGRFMECFTDYYIQLATGERDERLRARAAQQTVQYNSDRMRSLSDIRAWISELLPLLTFVGDMAHTSYFTAHDRAFLTNLIRVDRFDALEDLIRAAGGDDMLHEYQEVVRQLGAIDIHDNIQRQRQFVREELLGAVCEAAIDLDKCLKAVEMHRLGKLQPDTQALFGDMTTVTHAAVHDRVRQALASGRTDIIADLATAFPTAAEKQQVFFPETGEVKDLLDKTPLVQALLGDDWSTDDFDPAKYLPAELLVKLLRKIPREIIISQDMESALSQLEVIFNRLVYGMVKGVIQHEDNVCRINYCQPQVQADYHLIRARGMVDLGQLNTMGSSYAPQDFLPTSDDARACAVNVIGPNNAGKTVLIRTFGEMAVQQYVEGECTATELEMPAEYDYVITLINPRETYKEDSTHTGIQRTMKNIMDQIRAHDAAGRRGLLIVDEPFDGVGRKDRARFIIAFLDFCAYHHVTVYFTGHGNEVPQELARVNGGSYREAGPVAERRIPCLTAALNAATHQITAFEEHVGSDSETVVEQALRQAYWDDTLIAETMDTVHRMIPFARTLMHRMESQPQVQSASSDDW
jgi:energy-coupling factor transporter ATP-binding protein EcfA2